MDSSSDKDILREIRDNLGDMPARIADAIRRGRRERFSRTYSDEQPTSPQRDHNGRHLPAGAIAGPPDRWRATERLLGAGGAFSPGQGQLTQLMRNVRELHEAWGKFALAFAPVGKGMALPLPAVPPPLPKTTVEAYEPYKVNDSWKAAPKPPPLPITTPPFHALPPGQHPHKDSDDFQIEMDAESAAAMREQLQRKRWGEPTPFKPEGWVPPASPPKILSSPVEPYKPLTEEQYDRRLPYNIHEDWKQAIPETKDKLPLKHTTGYPLRAEWAPPQREQPMDTPPALPKVDRKKPHPEWSMYQPLFPASVGMPAGMEHVGGGDGRLGEKLDKIAEKLDEVKDALQEGDDQEKGGAPSEAEEEKGGRLSMWEKEEERTGGASAIPHATVNFPGRPEHKPKNSLLEKAGKTVLRILES